MNLTLLSSLVAVIDRGSFAAAAPEIGCTPSAVSLQMKQLEAWFGRPLFDRSARTVQPTPFALEAAAVARDVGARIEALRTRSTVAVSGRVRLGAIATVQSGALPLALRTLRDRHPPLDVEIVLDDSDVLLMALKAGRIDAAVLVRPSSGGSTRLAWQDLKKQPFVLLTPPDAEAAAAPELLRRYALIRYDTALTGGRIAAQYVRRFCPQVRIAMEVRSIGAIIAMVAVGLGVSIVPQPRRALLEAHGVREVTLGRKGPTRQIAAVRRRVDIDSRNLNAVFAALASAYA